MSVVLDKQISVHLNSNGNEFNFSHDGIDLRFPTRDKVHTFFQNKRFDTVKFSEENKKTYVHFGPEEMQVFDTKKALRKTLSSEFGGTWIEEKNGKRRYFVDDCGWFCKSYKQVTKEEFLQRLNSPSTMQKVLGIGLGVLALAPGVSEWVRHSPVGANVLTLSLTKLNQKNYALGLLSYSLVHNQVDGQAVGAEFQVNTFTASSQGRPSVAALIDGGFVVAWESSFQDGTSGAIYGQRYDVNGAAVGDEFQVNTYTTSWQLDPNAAALTDGGFVVTWRSNGQDGSNVGIFGQRFAANGTAVNAEFQVNNYTTGDQQDPDVAALPGDGFIISWQSDGQDGSGFGIYGQRYDANGRAIGPEFQANTYTTNSQGDPSVTALIDGRFVITWNSGGQDGSGYGTYGQLYTLNGTATSTEFQINNYTTGDQRYPSVAAPIDGGFVVTWASNGQDGDGYGIYGQQYDANGNATSAEFQVNNDTTGNQRDPSIASLFNGGFVVTWASNGQDGDSWGIFGQRYDTNRALVGNEFQVNTYTASDQQRPTIAALIDGGFVVTWMSLGQDGDQDGVFGKRYDVNGTPIAPPALASMSSLFSSALNSSVEASDIPSSQLSITGSSAGSTSSLLHSNIGSNFLSSTTNPTPQTSQTELTIHSVTDLIYLEAYSIVQNGQIIGTFSFSGSTGTLDSNNANILNIRFNQNYAPQPEEPIPLFSIPQGQESAWQNIQIGDFDLECLEPLSEINPSSSGVGNDFQLIFTGADSCISSDSLISASIMAITSN